MLAIGVTGRSNRWPVPLDGQRTGVSMWPRIARCTCAQPAVVRCETGVPSIATIVSPGRSPAFAAGLFSGSAQPAAARGADLPVWR